MGIHDSLAPVQFIEDRAKNRIAEPVVVITSQNTDTIGLERVQGVFNFLETLFNEWKWKERKQSEMAFVIADHPRAELVQFACQHARFVRITPPCARGRY